MSPHVEYVFHLAGQPGVRASWGREFDDYVRLNVLATQRLLEAAKSFTLKKFVYASSSSVYGDAERFPTPEDIVPRPVSPYGVTKLAGEHLVNLYARHYGIPSISLRFFSVYGPRQRPDMAFHRFIHAMKYDEEITVYGDGEQTRDFTFVGDVVEGTVRAGFSNVTDGTFNLGGGSQVSVKQTIAILERILNRPARIQSGQTQQGDARNTRADIRRAAKAFGYAPGTGLEQGLRRQVTHSLAELPA
jgi:nucleoside-diphosphate-sugar epimerase